MALPLESSSNNVVPPPSWKIREPPAFKPMTISSFPLVIAMFGLSVPVKFGVIIMFLAITKNQF